VSWWQALSKCVQEFPQDHGGSGKASSGLFKPRYDRSFSLAAEMQQVTDTRRQPQQKHMCRPSVEIAAVKKYLFDFFQIALAARGASLDS